MRSVRYPIAAQGAVRRPAVRTSPRSCFAGKQLGERNCKVHLNGYDQLDLITGQGPSNRHEIVYLAEGELGAIRLDDYKYRFIDQPAGWLGGTARPDISILANLRVDRFERTGLRIPRLLHLVHLRVLAVRLYAAGGLRAERALR